MINATKWQATMIDNGKLTGGSGDPSDVNVSAVAPDLMKQFTISSSSEPSVALYLMNGQEYWRRGGVAFKPAWPIVASLADGTTLTITRISDAVGDLFFDQR
ncbi:hypothetical protein [Tumebacillus permanentifrigoris]|uniref:Uncharacterized protein n=1 Tax=Tumebacillus permanentifrigoris TaxID=378543 RepID=A0A316D5Y5_9BACL|nr:hypothetical protein [Tumebacillus permanentifrigoris]PWK07495.1 hypothetical protein C7459_11794 [Tumebacillus permanentifrigoris]